MADIFYKSAASCSDFNGMGRRREEREKNLRGTWRMAT